MLHRGTLAYTANTYIYTSIIRYVKRYIYMVHLYEFISIIIMLMFNLPEWTEVNMEGWIAE
jgi:hypothetical protein